MSFNPNIAFGLCATAVALRAKQGRVPVRDCLELATCALRVMDDDPAARSAVVSFLDMARNDPVGAGEVLLDFVTGRHCMSFAGDHDQTLKFDWQRRVDCGVG